MLGISDKELRAETEVMVAESARPGWNERMRGMLRYRGWQGSPRSQGRAGPVAGRDGSDGWADRGL